MSLHSFVLSIAKNVSLKQRTRRFRFFNDLLQRIDSETKLKILDIGGTQKYWEKMGFLDHDNIEITLLNLEKGTAKHKNFSSVQGDACNLTQFADKQFDIVFSNSLIEHLYTKENQLRMASEAQRVGRYYFVQTPNFYFPIEPHWVFPFFQFLPFQWRVFLTKNLNLGHYRKAKSETAAVERVKEVQLLTEKELISLFPKSRIYREYLFGLKKSITVYNFPEPEYFN
jgi:hypothetical protein